MWLLLLLPCSPHLLLLLASPQRSEALWPSSERRSEVLWLLLSPQAFRWLLLVPRSFQRSELLWPPLSPQGSEDL